MLRLTGKILWATLVLIHGLRLPMAQAQESGFFPLVSAPTDAPEPLRSEPLSPAQIQEREQLKRIILSDFGGRMTPEFQIPEALRSRVAFWFDIYTQHQETHHIIHHLRYPWIVYQVVDTTQTLLNGKGPLWLRRDRAQKLAQARANEIRQALRQLARRKSYDRLSPLEKELSQKLGALEGPRKKVFQLAAENVRTQLGQRDFFERGLINSSRYLPYMEEEFRRVGLPTELTRLPFVESSFNENARSKVGASGIWQIMPRTGQAYLIVNDQIDERNSPLKATVAAARLLRSYYRALDSWPLALTSYNNGIGNTMKAIKAAGSRDLSEIISRYHRGDFQFASSNFFSCFLAALYAEKYHELIFKNLLREPILEIEPVRLPSKTSLKLVQRQLGLAQDELLRLNLDLKSAQKTGAVLPPGFKLFVPVGAKDRLTRRFGAL